MFLFLVSSGFLFYTNIDTQWATWAGFMEYYKKNEGYLQGQIGNPEEADKPNKKSYDSRVWQCAGEVGIVNRLEQAFQGVKRSIHSRFEWKPYHIRKGRFCRPFL